MQASRLVEQAQRREPFPPGQAAQLLPRREDGALVYRTLQKSKRPAPPERIFLAAGMHDSAAEEIARLWLAAEVLRELGIAGADGAGRYMLAPPGEKMDWDSAGLVKWLKEMGQGGQSA